MSTGEEWKDPEDPAHSFDLGKWKWPESKEEFERMMMRSYYKLDDENNVVPITTMEDFYFWMGAVRFERKRVGDTYYAYQHDDTLRWVRVSTVFLGRNQRYGAGPPLVFETMLFDFPPEDEVQYRYSTWKEAELGHKRGCLAAESYLNQEGYVYTVSSEPPENWTEAEQKKWKRRLSELKELKEKLDDEAGQ
jgi:hypothetical protein